MHGLLLPLIVSGTLLAIGPARADRAPSIEERIQIEEALRAAGFARWGEIELDDGRWEVDDAFDLTGRRWEFELSQDTLDILDRDEED